MSLDLHSACAIGNFERVQDAVNKNEDLDQRNKGRKKTMLYCKRKCLFPLILTFLSLFNYLSNNRILISLAILVSLTSIESLSHLLIIYYNHKIRPCIIHN